MAAPGVKGKAAGGGSMTGTEKVRAFNHGAKTEGAPNRARLESLPALRFFALLQIIGYYFFTHTQWLWINSFNRWGNSPMTFFFLLSGFIFGYIYGGRDPSFRIDWWDFMAKRVAGLYPLYFFSLLLGFAISSHQSPQPLALYAVMTLGASRAVPSAYTNPISQPAWTVGAFLVLYAILPYSLRMIKSVTPWTRRWLLPATFFLSSAAAPALDVGLNTGILHVFSRAIGISGVPNFLLGLNVGVLYLEHQWPEEPRFMQRYGASMVIAFLVLLSLTAESDHLPLFWSLWRESGLFSPLYCMIIWYAARDRDIICPLLRRKWMQALGGVAYGCFLLQHVVYRYLEYSSDHARRHGYLQSYVLLPVLLVLAYFAVHVVQDNFTDSTFQWLRKKAVLPLRESANLQRTREWVIKTLERPWVRVATVMVFVPFYIFFVNYQGCRAIQCSTSKFNYDPDAITATGLIERHWFTGQDTNWFINYWTLPCADTSLLSPSSSALPVLVLLALLSGLLAVPHLVLAYTIILRQATNGGHVTSLLKNKAAPPTLTHKAPDSRGRYHSIDVSDPEALAAMFSGGGGGMDGKASGGKLRARSSSSSSASSTARAAIANEDTAAPSSSASSSSRLSRVRVRMLVHPFDPPYLAHEAIMNLAASIKTAAADHPTLDFVLEVVGMEAPTPKLEERLALLLRPQGEEEEERESDESDADQDDDEEQPDQSNPQGHPHHHHHRPIGSPSAIQVLFLTEEFKSPSLEHSIATVRQESQVVSGDAVMYVVSTCRLNRSAFSECLANLRLTAGQCPDAVGLVTGLRVDGSDLVMPTLYTIGQLNPIDRGWRGLDGPNIVLAHYPQENGVSPFQLSQAIEHGRMGHGPTPFVKVPFRRPESLAFFHTPAISHYVTARMKLYRAEMERKPLQGTADVVLEMLMHVAFLLSLSVLLTSPISGDYTDFGVFRRSGSGYDCDNGFGIGTEAYRVLAAHLAALYTGVYLFGFISTFSLRDGTVRYTILFYCMLFGLPIVALLDVLMVIVVLIQSAFCACCCTRKRREDMADEAVDKTKLGFQVVIEDDEDIYEEGRRQ